MRRIAGMIVVGFVLLAPAVASADSARLTADDGVLRYELHGDATNTDVKVRKPIYGRGCPQACIGLFSQNLPLDAVPDGCTQDSGRASCDDRAFRRLDIVGDGTGPLQITTSPGTSHPDYTCMTGVETITQQGSDGGTGINDGCRQEVFCSDDYDGRVDADSLDVVSEDCRWLVVDGELQRREPRSDPDASGPQDDTSPGTCGGSCGIPGSSTYDAPADAGAPKPPPGQPPGSYSSPAETAPGARAGETPAADGTFAAKLQIARARVRDGRFDVYAPITTRASGRVTVRFRAAGHTTTFTAAVDSRRGRVRFAHRLARAQARKGTGIVTLAYPGDADTQPAIVRLRAAKGKSRLRTSRPVMRGGRLHAAGTVDDRAQGVVRIQYVYEQDGQRRLATMRGRIRHGQWQASSDPLPAGAARGGAVRATCCSPAICRGGCAARCAVSPLCRPPDPRRGRA